MSYIKNKLDELIETYRKTTIIYEKRNGDEVMEKVNGYFTEYDARMIAERLVTDYHNHIVEKFNEDLKLLKKMHKIELDTIALKSIEEFIKWSEHRKQFLQDTNPKE